MVGASAGFNLETLFHFSLYLPLARLIFQLKLLHLFCHSELCFYYHYHSLLGGYRVFTPRRNNVSHGDTRLISQRIFWQIVFPATLFLILFQFAAFVGLLASRENLVGVMPFNLGTLINYQALLVGNLIRCPAVLLHHSGSAKSILFT